MPEAEKISHTGRWAKNAATGELFWSQVEWRIFGPDPKETELSYQFFLNMVHPDDRSSLEMISASAIRPAKPHDIPFRIILNDGSIKHLHSVGNPVLHESGQVSGNKQTLAEIF